ncbi:MAG: ATP-binding protein [Gammaproteobacteria bacterium]|nr:ATP-binding protein [Gammaproteobacteria bacterium]
MSRLMQKAGSSPAAPTDQQSQTSEEVKPERDRPGLDDYLWQQGLHRNEPMKDCSLENFVTDSAALSQRKTTALEYLSLNHPGMMVFFGDTGRGKTHMAIGIMREWAILGRPVLYWPLMQLLAKLRSMMNGGHEKPDQLIDWIAKFPGLLVFDEIGRSKGDPWDRDSVIYPILDHRQNMPTIVISNFNSDELSVIYDEAIASRLKSGKIVSWPGHLITDQREARR